ncbi:hypothetical protein ACLB2K_004349 [Fragaria x ananassa]
MVAETNNNNVLSSLNNNNEVLPVLKKTKGRRRVEIGGSSQQPPCHLLKAREGPFNKATKLILLTGAETAAIVVSGNDRMFGFGSASCDAVIHRYLVESDPHAAALESDSLNKGNSYWRPGGSWRKRINEPQ